MEIVINSVGDLEGVRASRLHDPTTTIRVGSSLRSGIPEKEIALWEFKFQRALSDCGCSTGALAALITLLASCIVVFDLVQTGTHVDWWLYGLAPLSVLLSSGLGKLIGRFLARRRATRLAIALAARISRSSGPAWVPQPTFETHAAR